jgi:hypothetical protein
MRHGLTCARAVVSVLLALGPAAEGLAGSGPAARAVTVPDELFNRRTAPLLLLSRPDIRADLGLTAKQVADADAAISYLHDRAAELRGKTGPQAIAARRAVDEAQRDWFVANLTPEQRDRLIQIDLQWEGHSALVSRPVVADALGLSNEQRAALKRAVEARDAARAAGRSGQSTDEQVLVRQALSVLTPAQRERWWAMLGRPFVPQIASAAAGAGRAR